jgi:hypothetical protein
VPISANQSEQKKTKETKKEQASSLSQKLPVGRGLESRTPPSGLVPVGR